MTELNAENIDTGTVSRDTNIGVVTIEPSYLGFLRSEDFRVTELLEAHAVPSSSKDAAHIVLKIETRDKRESNPTLDVVEDTVQLWVCDCADFTYRRSANVQENEKPSECEPCKHIQAVSKVEKAKNDDSQTRLE